MRIRWERVSGGRPSTRLWPEDSTADLLSLPIVISEIMYNVNCSVTVNVTYWIVTRASGEQKIDYCLPVGPFIVSSLLSGGSSEQLPSFAKCTCGVHWCFLFCSIQCDLILFYPGLSYPVLLYSTNFILLNWFWSWLLDSFHDPFISWPRFTV